MDPTTRRRLLGVLVALTLGLLVADLSGSSAAGAVRAAAGTVLGPVQRALAGAAPDELDRLERENARLAALAARQRSALDEAARTRTLLDAAPTAGHASVVARVVGTDLSPLGGRSVTLDVGSRDGVPLDATVVSEQGLVGRVVAVAPWTCDVQVLGSAGSVVGVRVGASGALAILGSPAADAVARPRGSLTLSFLQPGLPAVGDVVRTLGSVADRPYAAGLLVGTVTAIDPAQGRTTRTATVTPAVDADSLDVVAVLLPTARTTPRVVTPAVPAPAVSLPTTAVRR